MSPKWQHRDLVSLRRRDLDKAQADLAKVKKRRAKLVAERVEQSLELEQLESSETLKHRKINRRAQVESVQASELKLVEQHLAELRRSRSELLDRISAVDSSLKDSALEVKRRQSNLEKALGDLKALGELQTKWEDEQRDREETKESEEQDSLAVYRRSPSKPKDPLDR